MELMLPLGHPDLESFIHFTQKLFLKIEPNRAACSQVEILDYTKSSESEVLAGALLEGTMHHPVFDSCIEINDGKAFAAVRKLETTRHHEFGSITNLPRLIFVRGEAKSRLISANLKGLHLTLLKSSAPNGRWPEDIEPLHLIWSSIEFPASGLNVFNSNGIVRASSECNWSEKDKVWYPLDGYELQPLLKYKNPLPAADIALSKEHFGGYGEGYRRMLYSEKARVVLEQIGMKMDWDPVLVEHGK